MFWGPQRDNGAPFELVYTSLKTTIRQMEDSNSWVGHGDEATQTPTLIRRPHMHSYLVKSLVLYVKQNEEFSQGGGGGHFHMTPGYCI